MQEINGGATEMFHSRLLCQSSNQETRNKCCTLEGTTSNMGGGCN